VAIKSVAQMLMGLFILYFWLTVMYSQ
jgi:hypothetical protein